MEVKIDSQIIYEAAHVITPEGPADNTFILTAKQKKCRIVKVYHLLEYSEYHKVLLHVHTKDISC